MICLFLQVVGIPVSWKKLQISCRVDWIGWRLCFSSGTVSLRDEKRLRLLECVRSLLRANGRVSAKDLESFLGLSMWACALFPNMRAMLHPFCKDLWSPAATNFSVAPSSWHSIRNFLDDSLRFVQAPPHTAIPVGAKLLSARHVPLLCRADLSKVAVTHRRLWLRIECLSSSRRKLSSASTRALQAFERWLQYVPPLASMRPSPHAFADASAKGRHCCLGGFVSCPSLGQVWFSESFSVSDFEEVGIPFGSDLAKEIASCEALAQAGLILGLSALAPCCKFPFASPHSATTLGPNRVSIRCSPQRRPASGSEELIWLAVSAVALVPEFAGSASEIAELIWLWSTGVRLAVQLPPEFCSVATPQLQVPRGLLGQLGVFPLLAGALDLGRQEDAASALE